jgi:hypothetical protein
MQLRRWLYVADDSAVPPRWPQKKGIKVKTYEVCIPINELQASVEEWTPARFG